MLVFGGVNEWIWMSWMIRWTDEGEILGLLQSLHQTQVVCIFHHGCFCFPSSKGFWFIAIWEEYFRFLLHFFCQPWKLCTSFGEIHQFHHSNHNTGSLDYPFGGHQAMQFCDFPYDGSLFGLLMQWPRVVWGTGFIWMWFQGRKPRYIHSLCWAKRVLLLFALPSSPEQWKKPGCFVYILPSYIGISISHYKDPF